MRVSFVVEAPDVRAARLAREAVADAKALEILRNPPPDLAKLIASFDRSWGAYELAVKRANATIERVRRVCGEALSPASWASKRILRQLARSVPGFTTIDSADACAKLLADARANRAPKVPPAPSLPEDPAPSVEPMPADAFGLDSEIPF